MTEKQKEVYDQYGDPQDYINSLRELVSIDDLRTSDIEEALRDINFIRMKAEEKPIDEFDILEMLSLTGPAPEYDPEDWELNPDL